MTATSGPTLPEPSAIYDPATSSWRMFGGMFPSDSMPSLATLPPWGMTRRGVLYALPTSEPPTGGNGSSSLLPTPVADNSRGLPSAGTDYQSLPNAVVALLPTPAVNDMGEGKTPEAWDAWTAKMQAAHGNGNGHGKSLAIEAVRLLPTPRAQNGEDRNSKVWARPLDQPQNLENALARLPGASTNPPSGAGKPSSDAPHPDQLSLDPAEWNDSPPSLSSG